MTLNSSNGHLRRSTRHRPRVEETKEISPGTDSDSSNSSVYDPRQENNGKFSKKKSLPLRKSSRATKFSRSMKEQDGGLDFFFTVQQAQQLKKKKKKDSESEASVNASDSSERNRPLSSRSNPAETRSNKSRKMKSPAVSHSSRRRKIKSEVSVHSSEEDSEFDQQSESSQSDNGENEEDDLKIQRILASRSETRKTWRSIVKNMNTSEVENGSRWFQDESDAPQDHVYEERFLVKWADVGFLHCSWELEEDLLEQIDGARAYLNTFFRKSENGILFNLDQRGDGEYFNPDFLVIDRILGIEYPEYDCVYTNSDHGVSTSKSERKSLNKNSGRNESNNILGNENVAKYGILFDKKHPDYEERTGRQFLIKWTSIGYSESTYEFERDLIALDVDYNRHVEAFLKRSQKPKKSEMDRSFAIAEKQTRRLYKFFGEKAQVDTEEKAQKVKEYQEKLANFVFPNGGKLRDYQAEGVSWMLSNYVNGRSSILADEMGLGKTLQTAIYINILATTLNCRGPYLIVAPLSTIQHWQREFASWTDLNAIIYHGLAADREYIREYDFAFESDRPEQVGLRQSYLSRVHNKKAPKWSQTWMAQVVVTTPEIMVSEDFNELCAISWEILVVDEAHKLKNFSSKLNSHLRSDRLKFTRSLLLTGTPIQNNIGELWTLMNFIDPKKFHDSQIFLDRYGEMKSKERIDELHETVRPYILRRLKEDVEKSVPPKEETIIEVELTSVQKQYYRALYEKNVQFLHKNKKKAIDGPSINNLAMQLRKCCNHPFLLKGVEQDLKNQNIKDGKNISEADFLCEASGKLVLLDKLLPRLQSDGHRVLLFSQFKIMLDILEDYLRLRNMKYERIDGSITGQSRQMAIDRFQAKQIDGREAPFVMLLSTRAGGVGINLTAADTCIIYDSDWNPQNDLQAQARCHRIGQTKNVTVFRLLSRKSYEMQMFHMSSIKLGLDQAVLQGIENNGSSSGEHEMTKEEVERLLRHGAYDVFKEEKEGSSEKESNEFLNSDIDTILASRSRKIIHENTGSKSNAAGGTFSKAIFKASKNDSGDSKAQDVDVDDPDFWKKVVGETYMRDEETNVVEKKRKRYVKNYSENNFNTFVDDHSNSSYAYESESESEPEAEDNTERHRWGGNKQSEWELEDVRYLLDRLAVHGYNRKSSVIADMMKHKPSRYSSDSVKRMLWSLILVSVIETVDADVVENEKRLARAAKRKSEALITDSILESEAYNTKGTKNDGSAAPGASLGKEDLPATSIDQLEKCFRKVLNTHGDWLSIVFQDANMGSLPARAQHVIDSLIKKEKAMLDAFNDNVWPALKSRGWTSKVEGKDQLHQNTVYRYKGGKKHTSIHFVLALAIRLHPELTPAITSVRDSTLKAKTEINKLSIENASYRTIQAHLHYYGAMQLIYDRSTSRPQLSYPRKFLSSFPLMHKIHNIIAKADLGVSKSGNAIDDLRSGNFALEKLLRVSDNAPLPHPQWIGWHDAVLFRAIGKHGWIDRSDHYKAILEDTEIEWGHPFVQKKVNETIRKANVPKEDFSILEGIAARAAEFLNEFGSRVEEIKGFNKKLIITTYYLRKEQSSDVNNPGNVRWIVDRSQNQLEQCPELQNSNKELSEEIALFPSRQDLAKRAKYILANGYVKNSYPSVQSKFEYALLNQGNRANVFLGELLRTQIKIQGQSASNSMLARRIFDIMLKEAEELYFTAAKANQEDKLQKSETKDLANIVRNLRLLKNDGMLFTRQVKNVFRAILGIETMRCSNNSNADLFPNVNLIDSKKTPVQHENPPAETKTKTETKNSSNQRMKLRDSATGDIAISRALEYYLQRSKNVDKNQASMDVQRHLRLTSFETLLLSVVCSQGLPVWSEKWKELISKAPTAPVKESKVPEDGKSFKISWIGMGLVIERAAQEWKRIAFDELEKVTIRLKNAKSPQQIKAYTDKQEVLKHDAKTKEEAYKQALIVSKDPLLLAKKAVMLLEALRLRMGPIEFYRGGNQKKIRMSTNSDNGIGPRVLNWMTKEIGNWAKSLNIIDVATKNTLSFTSVNDQDYKHDVRVVALLEKNACRSIFAQIAQQTRLRSVSIINGVSGLMNLLPQVLRTLHFTGDLWKFRPAWWKTTDDFKCTYDLDLLCGILNFGYSGFEILLQHYSTFRKSTKNELTTFSRFTAQPRINQLTRELSVLEDSANVLRLLEERAKRNSVGSKRVTSTSINANSIQTGLGAFFAYPRKQAKHESSKVSLINVRGDNGMKPISPKENKPSSISSTPQVGSQVIDLCEASSDDNLP